MDARDLISGEAELADESGEESYDSETGEVRRKSNGVNGANGHLDDSSEEESEEDEEEERRVREGFIVEDEEEPEERERRRKERKKRRREEREEEEAGLDEEDLDLIGEANPDFERRVSAEPKLKRLKRGHKEDRDGRDPRGIHDIFDSDDEEEALREGRNRTRPQGFEDEFADFIEQDFSGDEGLEGANDDAEVAITMNRRILGAKDTAGLDEQALEDLKEAFGDGDDYDWALALQEQEDQEDRRPVGTDSEGLSKGIELKDVFEPSQLAEKMLTDEDNHIRVTDEPERFQIARKPYEKLVLTDEQFKEESVWISNMMLPRKQNIQADLREPFQKSIAKVLEFMIIDEYEVPFIFQHRKDYLIHAAKVAVTPDPYNPNAPQYVVSAEKLLNQTDLWEIFDYDLKFRALVDKRNALQRTYDDLVRVANIHDDVFEEMLPMAVTMEELQDVQDYLHFQYSSRLADIALVNGSSQGKPHQRRPGASRVIFEKIRNSSVYSLVRAFGITADAFGQNALKQEGRRTYTEDPTERPEDLAGSDAILDPPTYTSAKQCLNAAKAMFAEEIALSPKFRKVMRQSYFMNGVIDCFRTEKGLRKIDEQHPYYEFKYLRDQELTQIAAQPALFLRMLRAEEEGLIDVKVRLRNYDQIKTRLYGVLESDNFSEVADAWNRERREALEMALQKLDKIMVRGVKETMKMECEKEVGKACREEFSRRLDQAPFKPKGMMLGTVPRVLAISNGSGTLGRDPICWAWVEEDGRVLENGKFVDISPGDPERNTQDGPDVQAFVELVRRRRPDVIGVSGYSAETRKLYKQIEDLIDKKDLQCADYQDDEGEDASDKLEVVIVNDEVARLYQTSDRSNIEHPGFAPLTKYCVALAKYLQSPLKEYASLGRDVISISFDPSQQYVPVEKILKQLETAMVDMVNLCGVEINDAVSDSYTANLLPYVCGLGPRKASQLLKAINLNGGVVTTRAELVGDADQRKLPAVGSRVWKNCASFLYIEYDSTDSDSDYLDNTRVHPEDYDLGRKMAADALELDEEDIQAEQQENGPGAIVRKLIKDEAQEKVNDLILEEYAEQLEKNFNQRKRATLETIRAELQQPYEELRRNFTLLSTDEIFTMFTGETRESLCEGMIVPMSIKRVSDDEIEGKLDCGVDCTVRAIDISSRMDVSAKQLYSPHQTIQAKIKSLNRKNLSAQLSLLEEALSRPYRKEWDRMADEWDDAQERRDKETMQEKNDVSGRTQRVIKHPLFHSFNSSQAEEYLGSQSRGDVVIRPSSKGLDHLAVTWKVSNSVYQHIDVLELNKDNEFSIGKVLKIGGHYTYSDLDELIVNHVKAMARKVDELMLHEKYKEMSKAETDRWLTTYTEANPKRSVYAFCIDPKHPGYFFLCFKAGQHAQVQNWLVKVIPGAYELQKVQYQDMRALCNGFKMIFQNMLQKRR